MKVRITLEIDDLARRGLSERHYYPGLASRHSVFQEIVAVWKAHQDVLRHDADVPPKRRVKRRR